MAHQLITSTGKTKLQKSMENAVLSCPQLAHGPKLIAVIVKAEWFVKLL